MDLNGSKVIAYYRFCSYKEYFSKFYGCWYSC